MDKPAPLDSVCIPEDMTIRGVLDNLQQNVHGICIVVDGSMRVVGTITDGDCRRAFLKGLSLENKASDIMCRNFIAVDESFSPEQIELLMRTNDRFQIPVVDAQRRFVRVVSALFKKGAGRTNAALVLAGGKGSRMKGLTRHFPKPMLPVAGRPMLEHILIALARASVTKLFVSINYLGHTIKEYFQDGSRWGIEIEYLEEPSELGSGGPVGLLKGKVKDPFIVVNGDVITTLDFGAFLDFHARSDFAITLGATTYAVQVPYGVVAVAEEGVVTSITEKPVQSFPVNAGIYVVSPAMIELVPPGIFFPMTDLIQKALQNGCRIGAFMIHEHWDDVGLPASYVAAQRLLEEE